MKNYHVCQVFTSCNEQLFISAHKSQALAERKAKQCARQNKGMRFRVVYHYDEPLCIHCKKSLVSEVEATHPETDTCIECVPPKIHEFPYFT